MGRTTRKLKKQIIDEDDSLFQYQINNAFLKALLKTRDNDVEPLLVLYIAVHVNEGNAICLDNISHIANTLKSSVDEINHTIQILVRKNFLLPVQDTWYIVNPHYVFSGDEEFLNSWVHDDYCDEWDERHKLTKVIKLLNAFKSL